MDDDEHPLLNEPSLVALVLRAAEQGPVETTGLLERLNGLLARAKEPPARASVIRPRLQAILTDLALAGLLARENGGFALTAAGRRALAEHPDGFDRASLADDPALAMGRARQEAAGRAAVLGPRDGAHPEAYLAGVSARLAGLESSDNPYPADSSDHLAWENGWFEAEADEGPPHRD
jgi:hypothetical protein